MARALDAVVQASRDRGHAPPGCRAASTTPTPPAALASHRGTQAMRSRRAVAPVPCQQECVSALASRTQPRAAGRRRLRTPHSSGIAVLMASAAVVSRSGSGGGGASPRHRARAAPGRRTQGFLRRTRVASRRAAAPPPAPRRAAFRRLAIEPHAAPTSARPPHPPARDLGEHHHSITVAVAVSSDTSARLFRAQALHRSWSYIRG